MSGSDETLYHLEIIIGLGISHAFSFTRSFPLFRPTLFISIKLQTSNCQLIRSIFFLLIFGWGIEIVRFTYLHSAYR